MKRFAMIVLLLQLTSAAALLGGCGQKGPLYLPDNGSQQQG